MALNYKGRRKPKIFLVDVERTVSYSLQIGAVDEDDAEDQAIGWDYSTEDEQSAHTMVTLIELGV